MPVLQAGKWSSEGTGVICPGIRNGYVCSTHAKSLDWADHRDRQWTVPQGAGRRGTGVPVSNGDRVSAL